VRLQEELSARQLLAFSKTISAWQRELFNYAAAMNLDNNNNNNNNNNNRALL
jgi:hypothetical protein